MPFVVFHFSHDELLEFELDPELESESEPEELAGQSSRSCVAVAVSSISAVFFSRRLRFFGAASPAGEPLVRLEAALAACLPLELAGLAAPPAGPELLLAGSAVEAESLPALTPRPRPLPRTAKATKGVESAALAAVCRARAPASAQSNLATNQGT